MMNELYTMSRSLERFNLIKPISHRDIGTTTDNPALIVEINASGLPVSIDYCDKNRPNKLYTHSKGNHNSFPIIRIKKPLLEALMCLGKDPFKALNWENVNPNSKDIIVKPWTINQLLPICKQNKDLGSLRELIHRFPKSQQETRRFNEALVKLIHDRINNMDKDLKELIADILIGTLDKSEGVYKSKTQIAFDVADADKFTYNVRDPRLWELLIQLLCKRDESGLKNEIPDICHLTGEIQAIEKSKYPNPNLKVLGKTFLYIKNDETECLTRYGMKGLSAFKAAKTAVSDIENSLAYLTADEREFITWASVPGGTPKQANLLLAYVEQAPSCNEKIAKMMGNATPHEIEETCFEQLAGQVCGRLKEYDEKISSSVTVRVIVINKVDDGRKQVLLSQAYTAKNIIAGTDCWQEASRASPPISYKLKEKGIWKEISPYVPYPGEIVRIMGKLWRIEKKDNKTILGSFSIPSITLKEIYEVFIPLADEKKRCRDILQRALRNFQTLILYMGHCHNRKEISDNNKRVAYDTCLAVSLLSIMLFKLGFRREDTMQSAAYKIGQVMKLADILHREYCRYVRDNKMPSQLIGNSLMATALEMPNKALAMLAERIRIYVAWADTEKDNNVKLAKWAQKHIGNICADLGTINIPDEFDDVQRAQVLLGYLAKIDNGEEE